MLGNAFVFIFAVSSAVVVADVVFGTVVILFQE